MPSPPQPLVRAIASGAVKVNPARFKSRAAAPQTAPIGKPPKWMDAGERAAWGLFVSELPWLQRSDTAVLEVAAVLRARLIAGSVAVSSLTLLRQTLGQLGATPADRSRVAPLPEPADASEKYFIA